MKLDINKFKDAETKEFWLHIKKADGSLDYADYHTQEEIDEYNAKMEAYAKGRKPVLRECSKPFRMKFRSVHSQAYESALMRAKYKAAVMTDMAKKKAKDTEGIETLEDIIDKIVEVQVDGVELGDGRWREIIRSAAIGWENLQDTDGNEVEFNAEVLDIIIGKHDYYHIFAQIREALADQLNFMQESQTHS